jgi:hypothetical protein
MKYPRVNLLKKSEQRYQGAVSRRFLLVSIVVTPILFITIFSGVKLIQYTSVQSNLKLSREVWSRLSPRLDLYKEEQRSLSANKQAMELIAGWRGTQVAHSILLTEIQGTIPSGVQLTRLAIRSELKTSVYRNPEDFPLDYRLTIQGVAEGARAEDAVIGLRKGLLKPEYMGSTFESIKLSSMRKRTGKGGQSMREFRLEGSGTKGDVQ